jgi:hypothetical protein
VRVHQAGSHDLPGGIHQVRSRDVKVSADLLDNAIPDVDIRAGEVTCGIHRQDVTTANQEVNA